MSFTIYKKYFLLKINFVMLFWGNVCGQEAKNVNDFPHINMQKVAMQKQKIEIMLHRDKVIKIAAAFGITFTIGGLMVLGWRGLMNERGVVTSDLPRNPMPQNVSASSNEPVDLYSMQADIAAMRLNIDKIICVFTKKDNSLNGSRFAKAKQVASWIWSQFTFSFLASLASMASHPLMKYAKAFDQSVDRVIERFFHETNLPWFLKEKSSLIPILDDIEQQLCAVGKEKDLHAKSDAHKKHELNFHKEAIAHSWALSIQNVEVVLAFMYAKADFFGKNSLLHADHAKSIANRVIMLTDNCSMEISYALAKDQQEIFNIIHSYKIALQHEILRFEQCENFLITA